MFDFPVMFTRKGGKGLMDLITDKITGTKARHKLSRILIYHRNINRAKLFVCKKLKSTLYVVLNFVDYPKQCLNKV